MQKTLLCVLLSMLLLTPSPAHGQSYCGVHKYDGTHRNELRGYLIAGDNIVTDAFYGLSVTYKRYLGNRWHVKGDMQMQFGKRLYSIDVEGGYRLPWGWSDFYLTGLLLYNRYQPWNTNETVANLSVRWEMPYFYLRAGASLIHFHLLHFGYTEPVTLTLGGGVSIRPRWNSWNIGAFIRNYDDFYYEGYNINWGFNFHANLLSDLQLYGELNIRPAGSMSQLASKYEESLKVGLKYMW